MSQILYADDHEAMRLMVRDLLQVAGHEVQLASDGASALAAVRAREPDLLILDVSMPGLTGFEVCRVLKSDVRTARIPVLMLTGEGDVDSKVTGFEVGADDYLAKPFDPRELRARVAALLRLVRREGDRNPTSGLPGGRAIEEAIAERVASSSTFAVLYVDIDHFKPFGDAYGFATADAVIRETGAELMAVAGQAGDFVGHVGGDDFVVVTDPARAEPVARELQHRFRHVVARHVGPAALDRGAFRAVDRAGTEREFPLARVSVAGLLVRPERWRSLTHLGAMAADVKRRAKAHAGGIVFSDAA